MRQLTDDEATIIMVAELNGPGKGCHACDGACSCGGSKDADVEKLVAEVTKKILAQMK